MRALLAEWQARSLVDRSQCRSRRIQPVTGSSRPRHQKRQPEIEQALSGDVQTVVKRVFIKTYGCQMNNYDSARMMELLEPLGFRPVKGPKEADLIIYNTCHIREKAAEKVYSELGKIRQLKIAKARAGGTMIVAVGGCVGQAEGAEILRRAPFVDVV